MLGEQVRRLAKLSDGFARVRERLGGLVPIDAVALTDLPVDDETTVLAFLKRFEQFEDALNQTLKLIASAMALGKVERLSGRDVALRVHRLGILDSAETWSLAVHARNELAHEYSLDPEKQARQINLAWETGPVLEQTWAAMQRFITDERLLDALD